MAQATIYLEQAEFDRLQILADSDEEMQNMPEVAQLLVRLFIMWEEGNEDE